MLESLCLSQKRVGGRFVRQTGTVILKESNSQIPVYITSKLTSIVHRATIEATQCYHEVFTSVMTIELVREIRKAVCQPSKCGDSSGMCFIVFKVFSWKILYRMKEQSRVMLAVPSENKQERKRHRQQRYQQNSCAGPT